MAQDLDLEALRRLSQILKKQDANDLSSFKNKPKETPAATPVKSQTPVVESKSVFGI